MNRYVSLAGLTVVALAAAVLSFASLRSLAIVCGTPVQLAWLLPVAVDASAVTATWSWLAAGSPRGARSTARALALTALALSIAGNAADHMIAAYRITPPWWGVVAVAAIPPAVLGATAHLAALVVTGSPEPQITAPGDDLADRARAVLAAFEAEGKPVGRGTLARELEIPEHQARQLLASVRNGVGHE